MSSPVFRGSDSILKLDAVQERKPDHRISSICPNLHPFFQQQGRGGSEIGVFRQLQSRWLAGLGGCDRCEMGASHLSLIENCCD